MEGYRWPPEEGVEGRASVQVGVIMSAKHVWVCWCGWVWVGVGGCGWVLTQSGYLPQMDSK